MDMQAFDISPAGVTRPGRAEGPVARAEGRRLMTQALRRRENLVPLLDRLAEGARIRPLESLDLVMALIEDAHSADPRLFGQSAAGHFARLNEARNALEQARRDRRD